jgi:hypothetical protein
VKMQDKVKLQGKDPSFIAGMQVRKTSHAWLARWWRTFVRGVASIFRLLVLIGALLAGVQGLIQLLSWGLEVIRRFGF